MTGDPPELTSANTLQRWPAGQAAAAACTLWDHPAPAPACRCGIYAAADRTALERYGYPALTYLVVGEVDLWGRIEPAGGGWRAQWARPARLWVVRETIPGDDDPERVRDLLAASYGVPVGVRDGGDAIAAHARLHP